MMEKPPFGAGANNNKAKLQQLMADTLRISSRRKPRVLVPNDPSYTNIEHLVFGTYRSSSATPPPPPALQQQREQQQQQRERQQQQQQQREGSENKSHDQVVVVSDEKQSEKQPLNERRCGAVAPQFRLAESAAAAAAAAGTSNHTSPPPIQSVVPYIPTSAQPLSGIKSSRSRSSSGSSAKSPTTEPTSPKRGILQQRQQQQQQQSGLIRHNSMGGHRSPTAVSTTATTRSGSIKSLATHDTSYSQIPLPLRHRTTPDTSMDTSVSLLDPSINSSLDLSSFSGRIDTTSGSVDTPQSDIATPKGSTDTPQDVSSTPRTTNGAATLKSSTDTYKSLSRPSRLIPPGTYVQRMTTGSRSSIRENATTKQVVAEVRVSQRPLIRSKGSEIPKSATTNPVIRNKPPAAATAVSATTNPVTFRNTTTATRATTRYSCSSEPLSKSSSSSSVRSVSKPALPQPTPSLQRSISLRSSSSGIKVAPTTRQRNSNGASQTTNLQPRNSRTRITPSPAAKKTTAGVKLPELPTPPQGPAAGPKAPGPAAEKASGPARDSDWDLQSACGVAEETYSASPHLQNEEAFALLNFEKRLTGKPEFAIGVFENPVTQEAVTVKDPVTRESVTVKDPVTRESVTVKDPDTRELVAVQTQTDHETVDVTMETADIEKNVQDVEAKEEGRKVDEKKEEEEEEEMMKEREKERISEECNGVSQNKEAPEAGTGTAGDRLYSIHLNLSRSDSRELLTRLQTERRSIRGSTIRIRIPPPHHPESETEAESEPSFSDLQWLERDIENLLRKALLKNQAPPLDSTPANQTPPGPALTNEKEAPPLPHAREEEASTNESADGADGAECDDLGESKQQQRSLSLPKSFLSSKYGLVGLRAALPSVFFPWRKQEVATAAPPAAVAEIKCGTLQPEACKSPLCGLPPSGIPARRPNSSAANRNSRRLKSTSSPVFGEPPNRCHSVGDLGCERTRPWSHYGGQIAEDELATQPESTENVSQQTSGSSLNSPNSQNSAGTVHESALQKFRKNLSLRLSQRGSVDESNAATHFPVASDNRVLDFPLGSSESCENSRQLSPKFRIGPLVWRASKDRNNKRGKKAARNAKCNSGDSGIQVEPLENQTVDNFNDTLDEDKQENDRMRKLIRYPATARLRRSFSQPMAVGVTELSTNSDEDAGLHLSEDEEPEIPAKFKTSPNQIQAETNAWFTPTAPRSAVVLWDHRAVEPEELSLNAGDLIHILDSSDADWWWAARHNQYGWVPAAYVQFCEATIPEDFSQANNIANNKESTTPSVRSSVLTELITAERDYVKLLQDIVEGYLDESRRRADLFSVDQIKSIFGNLQDLYEFQKKFLKHLEASLDSSALEDSVIGPCFLQHLRGFEIYSAYCNNQDRAAEELQRLYSDVRYSRFFETCRSSRGMIRLALDAFLLSPVQKICKYPLQLSELLKHTPEDHPDKEPVAQALEAMRDVAFMVNENKRKAEMQQQLLTWQKTVENWQGDDIIVNNSRLLHHGELYKVSMKGWTREVSLFLFENELVLCKRELIKRNSLAFKDRLSLDECQLFDVKDGKDVHFNVTVRHAFKLHSLQRNKWFLFCGKSAEDKAAWLGNFPRRGSLVPQQYGKNNATLHKLKGETS